MCVHSNICNSKNIQIIIALDHSISDCDSILGFKLVFSFSRCVKITDTGMAEKYVLKTGHLCEQYYDQ